MILQTTQLSPSQRTTIEELVGRTLCDCENIVLCVGSAKAGEAAGCRSTAEQMRYQAAALDLTARRMSIEDCVAAVLESSSVNAQA